MRLLKLHPKIYHRDCATCLDYMFDETTGKIERGRDGKPEPRMKECGIEFLSPCRDPARGCPKGNPENPKTLLPCNEMAYEHYRECRAVGRFPDDPIVRRNAAIIREIEDDAANKSEHEFRKTMLDLIGVKGG